MRLELDNFVFEKSNDGALVITPFSSKTFFFNKSQVEEFVEALDILRFHNIMHFELEDGDGIMRECYALKDGGFRFEQDIISKTEMNTLVTFLATTFSISLGDLE